MNINTAMSLLPQIEEGSAWRTTGHGRNKKIKSGCFLKGIATRLADLIEQDDVFWGTFGTRESKTKFRQYRVVLERGSHSTIEQAFRFSRAAVAAAATGPLPRFISHGSIDFWDILPVRSTSYIMTSPSLPLEEAHALLKKIREIFHGRVWLFADFENGERAHVTLVTAHTISKELLKTIRV